MRRELGRTNMGARLLSRLMALHYARLTDVVCVIAGSHVLSRVTLPVRRAVISVPVQSCAKIRRLGSTGKNGCGDGGAEIRRLGTTTGKDGCGDGGAKIQRLGTMGSTGIDGCGGDTRVVFVARKVTTSVAVLSATIRRLGTTGKDRDGGHAPAAFVASAATIGRHARSARHRLRSFQPGEEVLQTRWKGVL
jgi:hypothetical protein